MGTSILKLLLAGCWNTRTRVILRLRRFCAIEGSALSSARANSRSFAPPPQQANRGLVGDPGCAQDDTFGEQTAVSARKKPTRREWAQFFVTANRLYFGRLGVWIRSML